MSRLILASTSASRRSMLDMAGVAYEAVAPSVDEAGLKIALRAEGADARVIADALAEAKAVKISRNYPEALVLGADQMLALDDGTTLDKAKDLAEQRAQLLSLRGQRHRLIAAIVAAEAGRPVWRYVDTAILNVRAFSGDWLDAYLSAEGETLLSGVGGYRIEGAGVQLFDRGARRPVHHSRPAARAAARLAASAGRDTRMNWRDLPLPGHSYAEVIGDPISHSKSPLIHNFWLDRLEIDAEYRRAHVLTADLPHYLQQRSADAHWRGCNVTVPHKSVVLSHVLSFSEDVTLIGAANTLAPSGAEGDIAAHNTDWKGFLRPLANTALEGRHAIVIGAGGASRAVLYALKARGVEQVTLVNRTRAHAEALLEAFDVNGRVLPPGAPLPNATLLVNASSLGMVGAPPLLLDLSPLPRSSIVYDIVYAPRETPLMNAARARGLTVIGGLPMLIGQAAEAFGLFFDTDAVLTEEDDALLERLTA